MIIYFETNEGLDFYYILFYLPKAQIAPYNLNLNSIFAKDYQNRIEVKSVIFFIKINLNFEYLNIFQFQRQSNLYPKL